MKKALIVIALLVCVVLPPGAAASLIETEDGVWWQSIPEGCKVHVVQGMIDAIQTENLNVQMQVVALMKRASDLKAAHVITAQQWWQLQVPGQYPPVFSKTFQTYVDEVDDFFVNNPQTIKVDVGSVLTCLEDHPVVTCYKLAKQAESQ